MRHLIADCNIHFGDNPFFAPFKDFAYIGFTLEIPVHIKEIDENADTISIIITSLALETIVGDGHFLMINDKVVGRFKDADRDHLDIINIPKVIFRQLITPKNFMLLKIRIDDFDRENPGSGLLDDFIITKIEIENAVPGLSIKVP